MARIAVAGFQHETNCFLPETTDFDYFASHRDRPPLVRDGAVIEWLSTSSFALSGFLAEMPSHEIVPLLWTSGGAGGLVTGAAFERIAGEIVGRLSERLPVDAVYLDLHGAMVTEAFEDGEGELLRRVRAAVNYLAGFPASDLFDCGPAVVVHAWTEAAAERAADRLLREIEAREADFGEDMVSPQEGVRRAMSIAARASRPVILADTQDNPGCGGTADTTGLLAELMRANAQGAVLGYFCDPDAARRAHAAGVGAKLSLELGGRSGPEGVVPFFGTFRVDRLGDGRMRTTGPVSGGRDIDLGSIALLTLGGVSVVVTSKRMQALDKAPFLHLGVELARQKILALKNTCHFRAEFGPIAEEIIIVLAPGRYLADPSEYPYRRLRPGVRLRPLGPPFPDAAP